LNDATITALAVDNKNNIIAISKKGLNIIDAVNESISYIDANQGLNEVNTDLNCITGKENIYIVSNEGLFRYTPTQTSLEPKVVLENVQLFLNDVDFTQRNEFSHDENNLAFSYAGISYSHPDKIKYQYRLLGLNKDWITTKDNRLNLPKLPSGKYTFQVKASVNDHFYDSQTVSYSFTINQPFWLHWWFIAFSVAALGLMLYAYIKQREQRVEKWERSEKEKIQAQFETLKNQVNPHFLFNSFNTLISVIEKDQQMAVTYVEHLSDLFRKVVTYRDKDVISLKEEIEILENYFFIQKKRFVHHLVFENKVSAEDQVRFMIAPLTLQLLVENAVKHNAISHETPLKIGISVCDKYLVVKNNLNPKFSTDAGAGMGLQNIEKRYKLLTREPVAILKSNDAFLVKIPLLTLQAL
jgi:hypothetical protein